MVENEYVRREKPRKEIGLGVTDEHTLVPRMTWRDRARRLWGFFRRRKNVVQEDLREMSNNAAYFGERSSYVFSRMPYFETKKELEPHMRSDLSAIFEHNLDHFNNRETEFHGNPELQALYQQLHEQLGHINENTFRQVFRANINQNSSITNPLVRTGTKWWGFWRRSENVNDKQAPRVGEAWYHFYQNHHWQPIANEAQGENAHGQILRLLRNIYEVRARAQPPAVHEPEPQPEP
ncbi:MAG: hypothetical protein ABH863_05370, partial [Candidatus Micrarchaeota archaeon]